MNSYKSLVRPFLFSLSPETAHDLTLNLLKKGNFLPYVLDIPRGRSVELFGLRFKNKIGLAAGLDKNAEAVQELADLGFGFIEIGTVTPKPQRGNPRPRMFRLLKDTALINRLGFNNLGVKIIAEHLQKVRKRKQNFIIGGNIGKNKSTPNEQAWQDYQICFERLFDLVDYFTVNVSSPNTPDLRALQEHEALSVILDKLQNFNQKQNKPKPILLKIAPDLTFSAIDSILDTIEKTQINGVVATNTTVKRPKLKTNSEVVKNIGAGGLSGSPLYKPSNTVIKYISQKTAGKLPIIGVGGIMNAEQGLAKLAAGAHLIQIYTGFVYGGWSFLHDLIRKC